MSATRSERFEFPGSTGHALAARLDLPSTQGPPRAVALFAHCFTCGKDLHAASRVARGLADRGIAVLRFDFTGLGHSEGEFASTNFSSNVDDLIAAAAALRERLAAPALLIGHSLGGSAVLAAASRIPESVAVATIGAPASPDHVLRLFKGDIARIEAEGEAEVDIAGRRFRIQQQFLEDIAERNLEREIGLLKRALLVLHSPIDTVVGIDDASRIFLAARHPKSFVSLDGADHLLSKPRDSAWVADLIASWAARFLPEVESRPEIRGEPGETVVSENGEGRFGNTITIGPHRLVADEPESVGGLDAGPTPYGLLLASLGSCTAMTLRMYAERKGLPLDHVSVRLRHEKTHARDCEECETDTGHIDHIDREITLTGTLDQAQRSRLLEIADRCPVHRTLHSEIWIESHLAK